MMDFEEDEVERLIRVEELKFLHRKPRPRVVDMEQGLPVAVVLQVGGGRLITLCLSRLTSLCCYT
jgi:hypothetical protein